MKQMVTALLAAVAVALGVAEARVRIDITQATVEPMPVAVPDFVGADGGMTGLGRDITGVIMADLDRSGLFSVIDQRAYIEKVDSVDVRPRFPDWRIINAQVLVVGAVRPTPDGRIEVATRVWDVYSNEQLGAVSFTTPADNGAARGTAGGHRRKRGPARARLPRHRHTPADRAGGILAASCDVLCRP